MTPHIYGDYAADPDDVFYDPTPTDAQMLRFHAHEYGDAFRNVLRVLTEWGPHTSYALREATAHSEATLATVLGMLVDAGHVVRKGRRWAIGWVPTSVIWPKVVA